MVKPFSLVHIVYVGWTYEGHLLINELQYNVISWELSGGDVAPPDMWHLTSWAMWLMVTAAAAGYIDWYINVSDF